MAKPVLYLLIGYPGAGKTTVAKIIHEATDAVHLWSDIERHKMFGRPSHSEVESLQLYDELNRRTENLLAEGRSVVFDTNFNFHADRQKLHAIADRQGADTVAVWVTIPKQVARQRAIESGPRRNGYHTRMTDKEFDRIVGKLEVPTKDEKIIKIDGTKLDRQTVLALLSQYHGANVQTA
ncbi:MAG TPA: AAA family ATPase [Candidatus Saccharimonadales bacterium]|nr:AAA family ATPase [Candidatus Saccharimonadales bacterium]